MQTINKALAFLLRDLRTELAYRLSFFMQYVSIFFQVTMFYYLSKLVGQASAPFLGDYNGDYFSYVLIGIAFLGFQSTGLYAFRSVINSAQSQGTLEAMLVTPTRLSQIILFSSISTFLFTALNVVIYLVLGSLLFQVDLSNANVGGAVVVTLISVAIFSGIGIISAAFIVAIKRGDPVSWLFSNASSLLGGAYFPIGVLPRFFQGLAYLFPVFYTLKAMRAVVLNGAGLLDIGKELLAMGAFAAVIIPASMLAFKKAVDIAKNEGSLGTY